MLLVLVYQGYNLSCALSVEKIHPTVAKLLATLASCGLLMETSVESGVDFREELSD